MILTITWSAGWVNNRNAGSDIACLLCEGGILGYWQLYPTLKNNFKLYLSEPGLSALPVNKARCGEKEHGNDGVITNKIN